MLILQQDVRLQKAGDLSKDLTHPATDHGFFVKNLDNNIKFEFNNQDEEQLTKLRMRISTFTIVPQGRTSLFVKIGLSNMKIGNMK